MAVTITTPLDTPINLVSTPSAGGTLVSGTTYYWKVLAQNGASTYFKALKLRRSDWSAEGSFTTDATNKQATLSWDAVTGATHYAIMYTTVSGNYTNGNYRKVLGTSTTATTTTTSYLFSAPTTLITPHTWDMLDATSHPMPGNLPRIASRITVNITGTETLRSVYNQIVSAGYQDYVFYDGYNFVLNGGIYIETSSSGSITLLSQKLILLGELYNRNSSFVITFGQSISNSYLYPSDVLILYTTANNQLDSNNIFNGGGMSHKAGSTGAGYVWGDSRLYDFGCIKNGAFFSFYQTTASNNIRLKNAYVLQELMGNVVSTTGWKQWDNIFVAGGSGSLPYYGGGGGAGSPSRFGKIFRDKVLYSPTGDIRVSDNSVEDTIAQYYDCEFPFREGGKPNVIYRNFGGAGVIYWTDLHFYFSLVLQVSDVNKNVLSGASVVIKDKNESIVESLSTNTDGYALKETGTVTTASTTTVIDSSKSWVVDDYEGYEVYFTSGNNAGSKFAIDDSTATDLILSKTLVTTTAVGDRFGLPVYIKSYTLERDRTFVGDGTSATCEIKTLQTPHTITISKAGYQTKVIPIEILEKTALTISLEKSVDTVIAKGNIVVNTDPSNSQSDVFI